MKKISFFTLTISTLVCCSSLLCAQLGPGWRTSARPTKQEALAFIKNAGVKSSVTLPAVAKKETYVTDVEAAASLGESVTPLSSNTVNRSSVQSAPPVTPGGNSADFITPEILNLARGLGYDATKIYEYVRNYIEYEDYFGSKKGAHLTLLEGSGNSFDQSSLLVALLRASGLAPKYKYGPAFFSYSELVDWVGLDANPFSHLTNAQFLSQNLLPVNTPVSDIPILKKKFAVYYYFDARGYFYFDAFNFDASELYVVLPHVWVSVEVNGTNYDNLSPAWKDYADSSKINLATSMGYSRTNFLTQAGGTTSTPDAISGLNYANISNQLSTYCTSLTSYLKANEPTRAANRIIGSRSIQKISVSDLGTTRTIFPDAFSSDWLPSEEWTAIPDVHISKIRIQLGQSWNATTKTFGTPLYDYTLRMTELRGRKISLSFDGNSARVHLDETLLGTAATVTATSVQMRLLAQHNHYRLVRQSNGTYLVLANGRTNQEEVKTYLKTNANAYAIVYSFGNPENHLRKREEVLDGYRRAGIADSDWRMKTEVLNVMGLNWMLQTHLQEVAMEPLYNTIGLSHHRFGRISQESSYYIDVGLQLSAAQNRISNETESQNFSVLTSFIASAMEHSVIEQMQGESQSAVSTIKLLHLANAAGQKIYRATSANWATINTATNLQNYTAASKTSIGNFVNAGGRALIPQNAQITLNTWRGNGYAQENATSIGMYIDGGLFGGYNSQTGTVNSTNAILAYLNNPSYNLGAKTAQSTPYTPYTTPSFASTDPVDMASGAFFIDKEEISIGNGSAPRGIRFERQYNSNRRYDNSSGLGYGWTHNYHMSAVKRSSVKASLGQSIAYHAVPFYVAAQVASDLHRGHANAKSWATAALVTQWFSDQIKYNAVAITMGNKTIEFVRMPDGTYEAPANMNYTLTRSGSGPNEAFSMTERHGSTFAFNSAGRIASITDLWGKVMTFTYSGSELTKVTDGYSRALNFTWTSGRISAVADTNSRSVGFSYIDGNLVGCTDVESKTWTYVYDTQRRMTETRDPSSRLIIRNVYDSESRVSEQYAYGDTEKKYELTYTGFCNIERNPESGNQCFLYDERSRGIGTKDPLGNRTSYVFDGHDHLGIIFSPEFEITDQSFDRYNNLTAINDPIGEELTMTYDSSQRLSTKTDKRGNVTTVNSYNAQHQPLQVTAPLNRVTKTTYMMSGEVDTLTDPENNVTDHDYNTLGQLITVKVNAQKSAEFTYNSYGDIETSKDGLGQTTTFTYNKRRQVLTTTLPPIAGQAAAVLSQSYDNEGLPLTSTDARGNSTSVTYTATAKPLTTTTPAIPTASGASLSNVITHAYDKRDWLSSSVNSLGHTNTFVYDAAQRLVESSDPLDRSVLSAYDRNSRPILVLDALNRLTQTYYSQRSEPVINTDALNKDIGKTYDENGNQTRLTNRLNNAYNMVYDAANRLSSTTTPTNKATTHTYFLNDLPKTITEPSGQVSTLAYDTRLRLQKKTDAVGVIDYGYDLASNLKTVTEGSAVISRNYDARNRLVSFTSADGDLIQYGYDANNNLTQLTYPPDAEHPTGKVVSYAYNARNLLVSVTDWGGRVTSYQYDRIGRLVGITRPNGTAAVLDHDAASQLSFIKESKGGRLFSYLAFQYDAAGQVKSRLRAPLLNSNFKQPLFNATYDADNRLATLNGQNITHDADGNMTYGSAGVSPAESSSGSLISPALINFTYNSRNQLTNADGLSYTYDAEGRRRSITDASGTTRDVIDPSSKLLVRNHANGTKTYYVYGMGLLYEVDAAEKTKTYHFDQVGSTIARTDDTGKVIGTAEYSAYGLTAFSQGDMATPFLYNGQAGVQTDANGLLNMRARYYSPYLMRFLNADPIGFSGGMNWFAYADGNPISLSDPFGLCAQGNLCTGGYGTGSGWSMMDDFYESAQQLGRDYPALARAEEAVLDGLSWINHNMPIEALGANPGALLGGLGNAVRGAQTYARASTVAKGGAGLVDDAARLPAGRLGNPMHVPGPQNLPTVINGRNYTGHALDQMQGRGLMPSVVEDTISTGVQSAGRDGAQIFTTGHARIIVNPNGSIKTVYPR
jgi:RHS repeat-associated protein